LIDLAARKRHFTGILSDNRERMRILNELERSRDQAEQATRVKSEFLAAMSHEIRTPMNGVIGMLDVLHQTSLKGDQVEMVELIRESAYSLLTIIDDILDYSKIEAGRIDLERIALPVEEVVERVCVILDRIAQKAGVELTLFIDPALPAQVLGDPNRLRQVLVNLLGNARKHTPPGTTITARVQRRGPWMCVDVEDNGQGIPADLLPHVFERFWRASGAPSGGTGLGLAIAKWIVDRHKGTIAVRNREEGGAAFRVQLPREVPTTG